MPMQPLIAGPVRLNFNPSDGSVRDLTVDGAEGLLAIYGAVRDQQWGTVIHNITDLYITRQEESFSVTFTARCHTADLDVTWTGAIRGEADGRLAFTFAGVANVDLAANRIGFCVLHPQSCAGLPCRLEQVDGTIQELTFPALISPHQPFLGVRALTHPVGQGRWLEVRMEGTTFETEDQRNWTDASFKTYCTPLAEPFPRRFMRGETVLQTISLRVVSAATPPPQPRQQDQPTRVRIPQLGLGLGDSLLAPWLSRLSLDHLRLELRSGTWATTLDDALRLAQALETALEIAVIADAGEVNWLHRVGPRIRQAAVRVARVLVFSAGHKTTLATDVERVKLALDLPAPCFVGSDYFLRN